jgi:hypothetical protein
VGGSGGQEGSCPSDKFGAVSKEEEEVKGAVDIDVVEETGDVIEKEGARTFGFDTRLCVVYDAHCRINSAVVIAASKLVGVDEAKGIGLIHDATSYDLFQELPTALKQGDGAVSLGCGIVWANLTPTGYCQQGFPSDLVVLGIQSRINLSHKAHFRTAQPTEDKSS